MWVDADGANDQVLAVHNISILSNSNGNATSANTIIDGLVHSTAGNISITANAITYVSSNVTANTGDVTFGNATRLTGNSTVTGVNVTFNSTVNDDGNGTTPSNLTVNASSVTTFSAAVGNTNPLSSLTTNAGGSTAINGGSVNTSGDQNYGDAVTLNAAGNTTTLTGVNVSFASTVRSTTNGEENLIVNATAAPRSMARWATTANAWPA